MSMHVSAMLRAVLRIEHASRLRRHFTIAMLGAYAMIVVGNVLNLGIAVAMTRVCFGKAGYGVFNFALSGLNFMCILAGLGVERLLVREVARCALNKSWGLMYGLLRWSNATVGGVSVALAVGGCALVAGLKMAGLCEPQKANTLMIAMVGLPFFAISILRQATMRGLHHVLLGIMPDLIITPILFLGLLLLARAAAPSLMSPQLAMGINMLVLFVTLVVGIMLLRRVLPAEVTTAAPEYHARSWIASTLPFTLVSGMFVLNSRPGVLLLGMMKDNDAVAAYSVALRGAEIVMFIVIPVNTVLLPIVAHLFAADAKERLQRLVTISTRGVFAVSGTATLGIILFGHWFLALFGKAFVGDLPALAILCLGQFLGTVAAFSANLLTMTGHERDAAKCIALSAALNIAASLVLIPLWGVNGAAAASAFSLVAGNLYMAHIMRKRTGIYSTVMGAPRTQFMSGSRT